MNLRPLRSLLDLHHCLRISRQPGCICFGHSPLSCSVQSILDVGCSMRRQSLRVPSLWTALRRGRSSAHGPRKPACSPVQPQICRRHTCHLQLRTHMGSIFRSDPRWEFPGAHSPCPKVGRTAGSWCQKERRWTWSSFLESPIIYSGFDNFKAGARCVPQICRTSSRLRKGHDLGHAAKCRHHRGKPLKR